MDSQIVPQLKAFANNLGFRGYSLLRKAFDTAKDKITNIFNKSTPTPAPRQPPSLFGKINVPILKPTFVTTTLKKLPNLIQKTTEKVINWGKWLKNVDKVIEQQTEQTEPTEVIEEQTEPTFTQKEQALQGFTRSYEIGLTSRQDPLIQLQSTRSLIKNNLLKVLNEMKGLKFTETLKIMFEKQKGDELIEKEAYFNAKPQTVTNEIEIAELLQITQQQIVNKIQQWVSEGSGWTIQSVDVIILILSNTNH